MKIAILGLGGVGGTVAGALAHMEKELITIVRGKTKETVQKKGFLFESERFGTKVIHPGLVSDDPAKIGVVDILLLCCKNYGLQAACEKYIDIVGADTLVIPLQNGVTASADIRAYLGGRGQVAEGYIYCFSLIRESGHVVNSGNLLRMGFGFADGSKNEKMEYLETMLREGGMPMTEGGSALDEVWKKYLMMCGNSAAFLRFDCSAGSIQQDGEKMAFLRKIYEELYTLSQAAGAKLPREIVESYMGEFLALGTEVTSSLYRDVKGGSAETELDSVIGGGCRLARELGVSVPHLELAYARGKEYK